MVVRWGAVWRRGCRGGGECGGAREVFFLQRQDIILGGGVVG